MPYALSATEWTDVIHAVAALGWPILLGTALFVFRKQLRELISRSEEIKTPIGEGKFRPPIDSAAVEQVKRQLPREAESASADVEDESQPEVGAEPRREDDITQYILDLATRDVRVAFIRLLDALETRVRDLASAWGGMDPHTARWQELLASLSEKGIIPSGVASNVTLLDEMRGAVVHGSGAYQEGDALAALDAGLDLLVALDSIPVQGYEVVETDVPLYRDESCTTPWEDVSGVIVRQHKPKGRSGKPQGPYPTRKVYRPNDIVGWQWSFDEPPREYFWCDPEGNANLIRSAWFVGEHLRRPN
jgi:hypothetical protein